MDSHPVNSKLIMYNTQDFKVGDTVWYNDGFSHRFDGKVHKVLTAEELDFYEDHYLIMVSTHIDDYLIIRPKHCVFATKEPEKITFESRFPVAAEILKNRLDK